MACTFITSRRLFTRNCFRSCARGEIRRASAAEAVARARADVAARGLNATVVQDYYAIASAQRKLKNAQLTLPESERFFDITQKQEHGGEVAHADVIKAQLSVQQHQRDVQDAQLAVEKAKVALGVLILPNCSRSTKLSMTWTRPSFCPPCRKRLGKLP